jgi:uncharacterized protein (TIGR02001 family)
MPETTMTFLPQGTATMTKLRAVCAAAVLAATASGAAQAQWEDWDASANIGIMSDYIFRGVYTSDASAFAGLDVGGDHGFYLGTWGADIQDGLEYDIYLGYQGGGDVFQWNVGLTGYYATDEAFATSEEWNAGFSFKLLSMEFALGDYDNPVGGDEEQTYTYVGATFTPAKGPYWFIGKTDYHQIGNMINTGAKGYWIEIGKAFDLGNDAEIAIAALYTPDALTEADLESGKLRSVSLCGVDPTCEYAMTVTITKHLRIGE